MNAIIPSRHATEEIRLMEVTRLASRTMLWLVSPQDWGSVELRHGLSSDRVDGLFEGRADPPPLPSTVRWRALRVALWLGWDRWAGAMAKISTVQRGDLLSSERVMKLLWREMAWVPRATLISLAQRDAARYLGEKDAAKRERACRAAEKRRVAQLRHRRDRRSEGYRLNVEQQLTILREYYCVLAGCSHHQMVEHSTRVSGAACYVFWRLGLSLKELHAIFGRDVRLECVAFASDMLGDVMLRGATESLLSRMQDFLLRQFPRRKRRRAGAPC